MRKSRFSLPEALRKRFGGISAPFQLKFGGLGGSWGVFGEVLDAPGAPWGGLGGCRGGLRELRVVLGRRIPGPFFPAWSPGPPKIMPKTAPEQPSS